MSPLYILFGRCEKGVFVIVLCQNLSNSVELFSSHFSKIQRKLILAKDMEINRITQDV